MSGGVAVLLALMWRSRVSYSLKAAALADRHAADHAVSVSSTI